MSGYGGPRLSERAQAAGVIEVLRKPLVRRDIAEPVARARTAAPRSGADARTQRSLRRRT
jgi:FixJ family two-component response regulator